MSDARDRLEPVPRRLRGMVDGRTVFDTVRGVYAWDSVKYPVYLVPLTDVEPDCLVDEGRQESVRRGEVRVHGLRVGDQTRESAAQVYGGAAGQVAGLVHFDWEALEWFEEDEQVFVHPRNPYTRVDALRSSRHVRVEIDGRLVAESTAPVLVFETGLPTRYYLDRTCVDFGVLRPSDTVTMCPYKGTTSDHWHASIDGQLHEDVAWSYRQPRLGVGIVAGLVAFYNDRVDLTVDGELLVPAEDLSQVSATDQ